MFFRETFGAAGRYTQAEAREDLAQVLYPIPGDGQLLPNLLKEGLPTTHPEPHFYASQNLICAGIVDRVALSEGG